MPTSEHLVWSQWEYAQRWLKRVYPECPESGATLNGVDRQYDAARRRLADGIDAAHIKYHLTGPNSNSVANAALHELGINWTPPVWALGYGTPFKVKERWMKI